MIRIREDNTNPEMYAPSLKMDPFKKYYTIWSSFKERKKDGALNPPPVKKLVPQISIASP